MSLIDKRLILAYYRVAYKRIQNFLIIIFKCLHLADHPHYLKELLSLRSVDYSMRASDILSLPKPVTTTYGLNSFSYIAVISSGTSCLTN